MSKRSIDEANGSLRVIENYIGGEFKAPSSGSYIDVEAPATGAVCAKVASSTAADVNDAVAAAAAAFPAWSALTIKARAQIMFRFHNLMRECSEELSGMVVEENGKNFAEAVAEVAKGNETVEWAASLPQLAQGNILQVSRGVWCHDEREPLGVVGCIVPFNFPAMVPMWTIPIALTMGNTVVCKPSEKVPSAMHRIASLLAEAGVPKGVFNLVHGTVEPVTALCDNPDVKAVTFVGSSKVAQIVQTRCQGVGKRVLALGGAKNHLVALPDCDVAMAAQDIVASFCGCAGQRCMAASALLTVGPQPALVDEIVSRAKALEGGQVKGQMGPVIDAASQARLFTAIGEAEKAGAEVLLDGRSWGEKSAGYWVGPTVLKHKSASDAAFSTELFGPVISVLEVADGDEALRIENANAYGNAASVYTTSGANAEYFSHRFRAGMIGVNIGVPVPREPFTFGGMHGTDSKFGDFDITGDGAMEFFSRRRKITAKWTRPADTIKPVPAAGAGAGAAAEEDKANFAGQM